MGKPTARSSYSLLQKKMNEIEKTKKSVKPSVKKDSVSNNSTKNEASKVRETEKTTPPASVNKASKKTETIDPNVPDRSYGDYFCSICDSHMNSDAMWEAHITGKRHLKNVSKGNTDSKYDDLDEESNIKDKIENIKDPVVGLQYIHEIRRREHGIPPMYNCFLCHASIATVPLVIEHVLSLKHRTNFVKEKDPEAFAVIEAVNLKKGQLEPLLLEECAKLEEKLGRGVVKVKQEKPKILVSPLPYKRPHDKSDDDEGPRRPYKDVRPGVIPIKFVPGPSWKSIDSPKRAPQEDCDWGSRENDMNMNYRREYSAVDDRESGRFYRQISPDRGASNRSYSRLSDDYSRRSPDKISRRSPDRLARRSPDRLARRSPDRLARRSPDRLARRSPDRLARRSPDRVTRRSPDRFARRSPDRLARRSDSHHNQYSPSPEQTYSYAEKSRSNYALSLVTGSYPSEYTYQNSSSFEKTQEVDKPPVSSSEINRREIAAALINLPAEIFLKMALIKLKGLQLRGIEELQLLTELLAEAKTVLYAHLPNMQTNLKETSTPSPVQNLLSQTESVSLQNPLPNAVSQINDLIFGARKQSDLSSRSNLQNKPADYNNSMSPTAQPMNYGNPVSSTAQSNFSRTGPPSSNYPPSGRPAASYPLSGSAASKYSVGPAATNYPPGPAATNYPPGPTVINYPPIPASMYNDNQSSSGIPGLTLTESGSSQQQSRNHFSSNPWSVSHQREQDYSPYKRF